MSTFKEKYAARVAAGKYICVGLDPDLAKIPKRVARMTGEVHRVVSFMCSIVDATHEYAAAYKPQSAFFEALGSEGVWALEEVIQHVQTNYPDIPIILDVKRGDIGNTNAGYVEATYVRLGVDAITIHPYLGLEANKLFIEQPGKMAIVLCRTSNPGAGEFQDIGVRPVISHSSELLYSTVEEAKREDDAGPFTYYSRPMPLYQFVAHRVANVWSHYGDCAVVVGATYPDELKLVRAIVGDLPILIPGLGSQGGKIEDVIPDSLDQHGWGVVLNNASAINFAFDKLTNKDGSKKYKPEQFAEAAAEAAQAMNEAVGNQLTA